MGLKRQLTFQKKISSDFKLLLKSDHPSMETSKMCVTMTTIK